MQSAHHVLKHLLLLPRESRDEGLHLPRVEVRHSEQVAQENVGVDEARPREEVDQALLVVGHVIQPLLHGLVVRQDVLLAESFLEDVRVDIGMDDWAGLARHLLEVLSRAGDHLGELHLKSEGIKATFTHKEYK